MKQGLCNGSQLEVVRLHRNCVQAKLISGSNAGDEVLISRVKLSPSDANLPFTLERTQFTLRLAYSMTINKAQGQNLREGRYLPTTTGIFSWSTLRRFLKGQSNVRYLCESDGHRSSGKEGEQKLLLEMLFTGKCCKA